MTKRGNIIGYKVRIVSVIDNPSAHNHPELVREGQILSHAKFCEKQGEALSVASDALSGAWDEACCYVVSVSVVRVYEQGQPVIVRAEQRRDHRTEAFAA